MTSNCSCLVSKSYHYTFGPPIDRCDIFSFVCFLYLREIAFLRVFQGFQSREIFNAFLCTFTKKQFWHLYSTTKWVLSFLTSEIPTSSTFLRPKDSHFYKKIFNTSVFLLVFPCLQSNRFYNQKIKFRTPVFLDTRPCSNLQFSNGAENQKKPEFLIHYSRNGSKTPAYSISLQMNCTDQGR